MLKSKSYAILLAVSLFAASAACALPAEWKLYVPGSSNASDPADDAKKAGIIIGPDFSSHFSFVYNTANGKKALKLDTRDGKSDALMFPLTGKEKKLTVIFKAKGSLIPDNGSTPFGIFWTCWQKGEYQSVLRHNQSNQIKGSSGQTSLKPETIASDWHDYRFVYTAGSDGTSISAQACIDGKLRHETKNLTKKAGADEYDSYNSKECTGKGNYFLFGEKDGSTNGFARYAYILIIPDEDVSGKSLQELSSLTGEDLVQTPVTANDPAPKSLRPAAKPAFLTMSVSDGIPLDIQGHITDPNWTDPSAVTGNTIDLDCLPYSKNKAEKVIRTPKLPKPGKKTLQVNQTGSNGSFRTITEAIAAAPGKGAVIHIAPGMYYEKLIIKKSGIKLIGDDPSATVIYGFEADTGGIDGNLLVEVNLLSKDANTTPGAASGPQYGMKDGFFSAENITFYNKGAEWNKTWKSAERRSIALCLKGVSKAILKNCVFLGQQDTMYLRSGRSYFENCYIEGDVDFICGGATALFNSCHIYSLNYKNGGYITAASPADSAAKGNISANGYVFQNCLINGDKAIAGKVFLGRGAWLGGSSTGLGQY